MTPATTTINLASPATPEFSSDELALLIGIGLPDAVAVLDRADGRVLGGNRRLQELLGIDATLLANEELTLERFLEPEHAAALSVCRMSDHPENDGPLEVALKTQAGLLSTELHLSSFQWKGRGYILVFLRPLGDRSTREQELRDKVAEQKKKTLEAIKSSLLIYQFTEKIKKTPLLTTNLLSTDNEAQLFERAAKVLTCEGLNYKDVTFVLARDQYLEVAYSTRPVQRQTFALEADHKYTRYIRDSAADLLSVENEILVPLRSRDALLGLVEVSLHLRERIFFDEFNLVSAWQKDALRTIGDMIGLLLDNLRLYREVKRQSIMDPLTGVYNRNYFTDRLKAEIHRCARNKLPVSLIFIDVDRFKDINDTYGHIVGDQVLRCLGLMLKTNLRDYDLICRYGGDEFIVLLPEVDVDQVESVAEGLLEVVRGHKYSLAESPTLTVPVSISVGVSVLHEGQDADDLLRWADAALYEAKAEGRNRLVVQRSCPGVLNALEPPTPQQVAPKAAAPDSAGQPEVKDTKNGKRG